MVDLGMITVSQDTTFIIHPRGRGDTDGELAVFSEIGSHFFFVVRNISMSRNVSSLVNETVLARTGVTITTGVGIGFLGAQTSVLRLGEPSEGSAWVSATATVIGVVALNNILLRQTNELIAGKSP